MYVSFVRGILTMTRPVTALCSPLAARTWASLQFHEWMGLWRVLC